VTDITLKQVPIGEYEYVDATFPLANSDVTIPYEKLKTEDLQAIRWWDVCPGSDVGGRAAHVYKGTTRFGQGYIVLKSTVAGYRTRLLLFTERR
jgi:hypothetical protein